MRAASIHKLETLTGHALQARDGEIGKLEEIYFDDASWTTRYFVVHTGGWLAGRDVLIATSQVVGLVRKKAQLDVDLSRDQVKGSPPVDTAQPVSRQHEEFFARYYELEPYWEPCGELELPSSPEEPVRIPSRNQRESDRPHLRSSDEVRGYHIHAVDGTVGHVADFLVGDSDWRVRFLEVATRNWLPSQHVLISPAWIESIRWADREVSVKVTREAIREAPGYDPNVGIGPDDEIELFEHYGRHDPSER